MKQAMGKSPMEVMNMASPMKALEEQTRRNIEMFQNAMRMFTPFPLPGSTSSAPATTEPAKKDVPEKSDDLHDLKEQIAAMQRKLDTMS